MEKRAHSSDDCAKEKFGDGAAEQGVIIVGLRLNPGLLCLPEEFRLEHRPIAGLGATRLN